ncbi:MAG: glycine cleavage system protein GcvH [Piscirickettsiaceae bacterium]|nr:glycine cleavage system protein GcvH [Piscirickettsiaceae bacterium]
MGNPQLLKYANTHEWVRIESTGELTVGITDHSQNLLGDVVFAQLPKVGEHFVAKEECMFLESVKSVSSIYMPLSGSIYAINTSIADDPELINQDSFGNGWLFKVAPNNISDVEILLSASDYESLLDS